MATTLGSVASSPARVASPMGGFRPSVSSSINSSVKMISIGPEGGKARVDTSFGSPFARMKPANPNFNPSGKIFGESGLAKPKTAESIFGPKISETGLNKPNPKVGYTPELSKVADISTTFTKAKIRNQELAAQGKNKPALESSPRLLAQDVLLKGNERIPNPLNSQTKQINLRLYQNMPEVKPLDQAIPAGNESRISESKPLTSNPENYKTSPINQVTKPEVNIFSPAQKILSADSPLSIPKASAGEKPLIEPVQKNIQLVESNLAKPEASLKIDIDPKRFIEPEVLVSRLDLSTKQPQSYKESTITQNLQEVQGRAAVKSYQTEKLSDKQKNSLLVLAPLIKEVDIAAQDRLISSIGLSREVALPLIEDITNSSKEKIDTNTESKLKTSSSPELI